MLSYIWLPYPNNDSYEVCNHGMIRKSIVQEETDEDTEFEYDELEDEVYPINYNDPLDTIITKYGYEVVSIKINVRSKMKQMSHLVLEAFDCPRPDISMVAMHIDNNPRNNIVCNLRWGTRTENMWQIVMDRRAGEPINERSFVQIFLMFYNRTPFNVISKTVGLSERLVKLILVGMKFKGACSLEYYGFKNALRELQRKSLSLQQFPEIRCSDCKNDFIDNVRGASGERFCQECTDKQHVPSDDDLEEFWFLTDDKPSEQLEPLGPEEDF